jgi:hypothetical protein
MTWTRCRGVEVGAERGESGGRGGRGGRGGGRVAHGTRAALPPDDFFEDARTLLRTATQCHQRGDHNAQGTSGQAPSSTMRPVVQILRYLLTSAASTS